MLKKAYLLSIAAAFFMVFAADAEGIAVKTGINKCKFSIGREHPGAKGRMYSSADGVAMDYDFTGGGLYTGIEYHPGKNTADHFEFTFHPKQTTRYYLRIKAGGRTYVTKQNTVLGGRDITVKISKAEKWRAVWGGKKTFQLPPEGIDFIMFCVEKSMHCPQKGSVILKSFNVPGVKEIKLPDMSVKSSFTPSHDRSYRSSGLEYAPGSKTVKEAVPEGIKFHYDFTKGGQYGGIEMELPLPYGRAFEIVFDAPQAVRVFGRVLNQKGFYETKRAHYSAGNNKVLAIKQNEKWQRLTVADKSVKELDGKAKRVMICVEKSQNTPQKGYIIIRKVNVWGAGFPEVKAIVPAKSAPKPVYNFAGKNIPGIVDAEYHDEANALFAPDIAMSVANVKLDTKKLDPEHFTMTAWVYPRGTMGKYRTMINKSENGSDGIRYDFQFCLYNQVPIFGFLDRRGHWQGQLRYYDDIRTGKDGRTLVPIIYCRQVTPDAWNFVAVTFNKGEIKLFVNGSQVADTCYSTDKKMNFTRAPLNIGTGFDGLLDNISVFDKSLTPGELECLRHRDLGKYANRKHHVVSRSRKLRKNHDPDFKRLLPMTAEYLKNIPVEIKEKSQPVFSRKRHNGVMTIFRNGVPESGTMVMPVQPHFQNKAAADDFAAAGVRYVQYHVADYASWQENGDYSAIDKAITDIFANNPNCRILIRFGLETPAWYRKKYAVESDRAINGQTSNQPSLSSEQWQADAEKALVRMVKHLENHPVYGHKIAAYLIGGGRCGEWYWWASRFGWIDYNPKNVAQFRKWLKKHYNNDVNALRRAWLDKNVTFETANIPSPKLRGTSEDGFFRSVKKARPVADHLRYMSETVSSTVSRFAKAARGALKSPKLIGFFNGYATWHDDLSNQGFYDFKTVIADPNVDFVAAPMCYINRRAKYAGDYMNGYQATIALHDKLYYDEADMRTCFSLEKTGYKLPTMEETRSVHYRAWGNAITHGVNLWWMLLSGNSTFHDPLIMGDIANMMKNEPAILKLDRTGVADIAVLCDEESMHYVNAFNKQFHSYNREARERLAHIGAPIDFYLMSDINDPKMRDYKVYVFLNAFYITPEQRKAIHAKLARNKAVAVWCYGAGYLSPSGNNVKTMAKLTGFDFDKVGRMEKQKLTLLDKKHPIMRDTVENGEEFFFAPGFAVKKTDGVSALGAFGKHTVLAAKETAFGTSIYTLMPPTPELLRSICRTKGIHLYNQENDVIRANRSVVMIHTSSGGKKVIDLPWNTPAKEVVSGKIYPAGKVTLDMKAGYTAIFVKQI